jgi:hypothetical protein
MNVMLDPMIVAAKIHIPVLPAHTEDAFPERITASSQGDFM